MTAQVFEGTWTDILSQAERFTGKRLRVQVIDAPSPGHLNDQEFEAALDALSQDSEALPVLSEDSTSRAGIYADHDLSPATVVSQ